MCINLTVDCLLGCYYEACPKIDSEFFWGVQILEFLEVH